MRLVHSFNTRPLSIDCYGVDSLRRMAGSRWDFIAQHYESSEWYEKENILFDRHPRVCASRGLDTHRPGAYNTGAIGFRDPALMESYLAAYKGMALELSGLARGLLDGGRDLTPDVIIEQRHAFQLCRRAGARVKLMLPGDTGHGQTATRIGYQHVVTSRKFELLDKCRAALLAISPEIHEKTSRICRNISRE